MLYDCLFHPFDVGKEHGFFLHQVKQEFIRQLAEDELGRLARTAEQLEADRDVLSDWLASIATTNYLSPVEFRYHLSRVVGAVDGGMPQI